MSSTSEIISNSNEFDAGRFEDVESPPPQGRPAGDETTNRFKLRDVARKGDWNMDEDILEHFEVEDILNEVTLLRGYTALHIAAAAERSEFGIKLLEVEEINPREYVLERNDAGNAAFWVAAASGKVDLARKMLEKNGDLASIRGREDLPYKGRENKLPLYMAALRGHREMVKLLYEPTRAHLRSKDLMELLLAFIETHFVDFAVKLIKDHLQIATASDKGFWETIFNCISKSIIYEVAPEAFEVLVELLLTQVIRLVDFKMLLEIIRKAIFAAAEQGNENFLEIILRNYPDLIFEVDENNYSIFHYAVMNRRLSIFELIHEMGSSKDLLTENTDKEGNTILHLAARLPPSDRLTPAEALPVHLRWEWWWFTEVRKILHPRLLGAKNNEGKTARAIFTEQHKEMKLDFEKWIKDTSNSMLMAATIIATITFGAIFQLPGGTDPKRGISNLAGHPTFTAFVVFGSLSILVFVHIFHSRFEEDDFLRPLPRMLVIGLWALFYSVCAMFVAFFIAVRILFNQWTDELMHDMHEF